MPSRKYPKIANHVRPACEKTELINIQICMQRKICPATSLCSRVLSLYYMNKQCLHVIDKAFMGLLWPQTATRCPCRQQKFYIKVFCYNKRLSPHSLPMLTNSHVAETTRVICIRDFASDVIQLTSNVVQLLFD